MRNQPELPEGYGRIFRLNTKIGETRRNVIAISAVLCGLMVLIQLVTGDLIYTKAVFSLILPWKILWVLALLACSGAYLWLHLHLHGFLMRMVSGEAPVYGKNGFYFYVGSETYFDRLSYMVIILAPVTVSYVILLLLIQALPIELAAIAFILQVLNIGFSGRDLLIAWRIIRTYDEILVKDNGIMLTVFGENESAFPV